MKPTNSSFQLKIASILLCLFVAASIPALAATTKYAVGTCQPKLQQFPTITAAVNAVPPSSTILVCPGTYPEQINLYQPVTLQGVASGNSSQAIITVPAGGMTENAISIDVGNLYAQVVASSTGVNISNLTVDGSNNNINGPHFWLGSFIRPLRQVRSMESPPGTKSIPEWALESGLRTGPQPLRRSRLKTVLCMMWISPGFRQVALT